MTYKRVQKKLPDVETLGALLHRAREVYAPEIARLNVLIVKGPLFAYRQKGRSKRGWTTPKGAA